MELMSYDISSGSITETQRVEWVHVFAYSSKIMSNKEGIRAMGELAKDASESAAADYDEIKQLKSGS